MSFLLQNNTKIRKLRLPYFYFCEMTTVKILVYTFLIFFLIVYLFGILLSVLCHSLCFHFNNTL